MTVRFHADGAPERRALEAWRIVSAGVAGAWRKLDRGQLHERQRRVCYLCAERFVHGSCTRQPLALTRDHVFPRRTGGRTAANILLAHRTCNEAKDDRWPTPCEVIYLAALYAPPFDVVAARLQRMFDAAAREDRHRAALA